MKSTQQTIDQGFSPVLGSEPKVLVLGTMPSVKSLQEAQYYGHPRNAFWWIMSQLLGFDADLPYEKRLVAAKNSGVAIWDVAHSCHRPGSLDADIDQSTLQANEIAQLLNACPSIHLIAFNGQAAAKLFKKFVTVPAYAGRSLILPSTSPANAALSKEKKLEHWQVLKEFLI
jgi:double-stranded uracil-DNA glycosylase